MHELGDWEPEHETRPLADGAVDRNLAIHHLRQAATDRKAESGSAVGAGVPGIHLNERVEHSLQIPGRNSDPRVLDRDAGPLMVSLVLVDVRAFSHRAPHRYATTGLCEFHGIGQQVREDLLHALRVAHVLDLGIAFDRSGQLDAFGCRLRTKAIPRSSTWAT